MSLILDALNKSNRDAKDYGAAPGIDAHHTSERSSDKTKTIVLIVIAGLIFIGVILLAVLLFKSPNTLQSPQVLPPPTNTPQPTAQPPNPTPTAANKTSANTTSTENINTTVSKPSTPSTVAALYATQTDTQEKIIIQPKVKSVSPEDTALAKVLWEQSKPQAPPKLPAAQPQQSNTNLPTKNPPAPSEAPIKTEVDNSIHHQVDTPFLHNLPVTVQNTIPTLMYADHQYGEGYVIVNKRKRFVGDQAANGVTLEQIYEDGATFSFGDTQFKLSAFSSWVNY